MEKDKKQVNEEVEIKNEDNSKNNTSDEMTDETKKNKKETTKNTVQEDEIEKLKKEILDLKNKNSELEDKLIRNNAELANFKRRKEEETSRILKYSNEDIVKEILPIIDNFERAIDMDDDDLEDEVSKFLEGFRIIYNGLNEMLKKFEVKVINPLNEEFDPTYHQAVLTDSKEDVEDNIVLEVMQKGYMLKDKVIRPAMVKVNKK